MLSPTPGARRNTQRPPSRSAILAFLRSAERLDIDDAGWLRGVTRAALPLLPATDDYAAAYVAWHEETATWTYGQRIEHTEHDIIDDDMPNTELSLSERATAASLRGLVSVREEARRFPNLQTAMRARDIGELVSVAAPSPSGLVAIYVVLDPEIELGAQRRQLWGRLATHLGHTTHLRAALDSLAPPSPIAVFSPDGACVHATGEVDSPGLERLRAHVTARERQCSNDTDAAQLVASFASVAREGWTVLDQFDRDGRRWLMVWDNPLGGHDPRRLTACEELLLTRVLSGWTNRDAAAELGLSTASASRTLHAALDKLGVDDLAVLTRWRTLDDAGRLLSLPLGVEGLHAIGIPTDMVQAVAHLTASERDVLRGVLSGKSDRDIGRARGTSTRTIANQVRTIFDKLGVGSRRELFHWAAAQIA